MSDDSREAPPGDEDPEEVPVEEIAVRWTAGFRVGGGALALCGFLLAHPGWDGPCIGGVWLHFAYAVLGLGLVTALAAPLLGVWVAPSLGWRENLYSLALALILALTIRAFGVQAFKIPSGSMLETLQIGDHLLVNKFVYGIRIPFTDVVVHSLGLREPRRGDVVVFRYPRNECQDYIKRIIGLPGETIEVRSRSVFVDGTRLDDGWGQCEQGSPLHGSGADCRSVPTLDEVPPVVVPEGEYFVMGDNREHSQDSRIWGTVERDKIVGKAWRIYWSWDGQAERWWQRVRWGRLGDAVD